MGSYAQRGSAPLGRPAQPVRRRDPNRVPDDHLDSKRGRLDSGGRNLADLPVWNYLPVLRPQHIFDLEPEGFGWFCGFVAKIGRASCREGVWSADVAGGM